MPDERPNHGHHWRQRGLGEDSREALGLAFDSAVMALIGGARVDPAEARGREEGSLPRASKARRVPQARRPDIRTYILDVDPGAQVSVDPANSKCVLSTTFRVNNDMVSLTEGAVAIYHY